MLVRVDVEVFDHTWSCINPFLSGGIAPHPDVNIQEGVPIHKIEARAKVGSNITDNEIDRVRAATNDSVEEARPDLHVMH